jgi:signal transduction histidine kinase/outer membrane protein OmpA-like peptidoglycan-associated protein
MEHTKKKTAAVSPYESLLVTTPKKLLKPRIQNKLILAFVFTAVISIAASTYLVIKIMSQLTENEIERKIRSANEAVLAEIDHYEEQAVSTLQGALKEQGFVEALKKQKVSYIFTPPISTGSEAPIGLWVPSGQPMPGTPAPLSSLETPSTVTKTVMQAEVNNIQTLLAGAVATIAEDDRHYGTLAIGYALGKSFAQDAEIMTGADIRIFYEKISAGPSSIFFKGSSADLSDVALAETEEIASTMREHPRVELIVEGHTDSTGSEKQNYRLGLKRARAVKNAIVKHGINPSRIQTISFGETRAIALETDEEGEADEEGRALNRRVELEFKSHKDPLVGAIEDLPMTSLIKQSIFGYKQRYYDRNALFKGEPYRAIYQPLVGYGGKVLGLIFVGIPKEYTFEATVTTWYFFPIILLVGFLLATVIGYTISRGISRPIRHLYRGVLAVADGDLDQHFDAETKDEIGDLGRAFNIMTKKLRQLKELEQEMQRRNRLTALGELSAGVAHEIRNPLGVIKNSAEILRKRNLDDARMEELTGYIVEEVERLNRVITNFLQFARPAEPALDRVDINEVLEHTISFLAPEAQIANISIEKKFQPDLPPVLADSEQCHQVFLNLCMNAFQAMNGEGSLTVETRNSEMVDVLITDTGEGIPAELTSRVFDPFFSTKDDGTGLGLSLVHKIIENHKGRIRVSSTVGAGTTFIVSLPKADRTQAKD